MEVESCLPPPKIRLDNQLRAYSLRLLKLGKNHIVNKELTLISHERLNNPRLKPTQLEVIKKALITLDPLNNLEKIKPFYFPPWKSNNLKVIISNKDKEEATKEHQDLIHNTSSILAYSDASYSLNKGGIGVGLAILKGNSLIYSKNWNLGPKQLVYNGKLIGIVKAIDYISLNTKPGASYKIFSDNKAALQRLKSLNDNPGQQNLRKILKRVDRI